jgi:hypothetical protein
MGKTGSPAILSLYYYITEPTQRMMKRYCNEEVRTESCWTKVLFDNICRIKICTILKFKFIDFINFVHRKTSSTWYMTQNVNKFKAC